MIVPIVNIERFEFGQRLGFRGELFSPSYFGGTSY